MFSKPVTEEKVREQLKSVKYPGFSRDIVSFGIVRDVTLDGKDVSIKMALATNDPAIPQKIKTDTEAAIKALSGVGKVKVIIDISAPPTAAAGGTTAISGIKHVIAIASGKGGVGKSTVASNIAAALSLQGASVGLCDCDMYGPSMAIMFGARERPAATDENQIIPLERYGIKLMSMGFLLDDDSPAILRGPMVTRYTQQFLRQVEWGELDFLILDLPPGTGDIQLTIVQTVALAGAVIVTTPQEVALIDARKAATMFQKVNVPLLGLVENMSFFQSPSDGKRYDIFGNGGGRREATRLGIPFLGEVPIDISTRESGDRGQPIVISEPLNPASQALSDIAAQLHRRF
ncbi:MAG TPA: Mrp/NBP35 family ATP-binding protein [Chthoniobacterales bacterium]|jgi:ATP-binding protein involved in chromosome partitioning